MDYFSSFAISSAGMSFERLRLNVASLNIANANVAYGAGAAPVKPLQLVTAPGRISFNTLFADQLAQLAPAAVEVQQMEVEPRLAHDPQHPLADDKGYVRYSGVNMATEMLSLMTAVRGYEANVVAFNAAKVMTQKAIELGSSR